MTHRHEEAEKERDEVIEATRPEGKHDEAKSSQRTNITGVVTGGLVRDDQRTKVRRSGNDVYNIYTMHLTVRHTNTPLSM